MGSWSEIHARVSELLECESELNEVGWDTFVALPIREKWQEAFEDLNRFFSALEIRQMMAEVKK